MPVAHATFPGENGRIVFDTADGPAPQIYTVNPDGSDVQQLTHIRHGAAFMPRWSADGRRIAYVSDASGNDELWTMRADGTHKRQITDEPGVGHYWPTWTPTGWIVFSRCDFTAFGTCTIDAVRRDGSHPRTIVGGHWHHGQPAVSPDGDWIVFTSDKGGYDGRMWLVHPDGTGLHLVGESPAMFADRPDWAPDGSLITFTGDPHFGRVFVIAPDGSGLQPITDFLGQIFATFSPDGTRMVLLNDVGCDCRTLELIDTGGSELGTVSSMQGITFSDWGVAA
jgi:Tol biopolymer transport system component